MGEKPDEMRSPPQENPEQIRQDIQQTRAEMAATIDAIQDRLSPQHVMEQAKDTVREATVGKVKDMVNSATDTASDVAGHVQDTAQQAFEYVRENPLPAVLIGVGVAWMLMRTQRSGPRQAQQAVSGTSARVQESWQYYSRRTETEFERWMRENPLTVGVAAVAIGAAVGLSMPRTETEDELMGETRDSLVERAQDVARDKVQQAQQVVDTAQDTVNEAARAVGGASGGSTGGRSSTGSTGSRAPRP
jgi:ElaB/YqjD/DUF883 family membrane-anchored ribosome-binding protein